jgi:hypothetical protein
MTVNRVSMGEAILIVMPLELLPETGSYAGLCGKYEMDEGLRYYREIFYVEKVVD